MLGSVVRELSCPHLVARFQRWCGVEQIVVEQEEKHAAANGCHNNHRHDQWPGEAEMNNSRTATRLEPLHNFCRSHVDGDTRHRANHTPLPAACVSHNNNCPHLSASQKLDGYDSNDRQHVGHEDSVSNGVLNHRPIGSHLKNGTFNPASRDSTSCAGKSVGEGDGGKETESGVELKNGHTVGKKKGAPVVRTIIRYRFLYYWAHLGAMLGNEEFYLTVMPFLLWTVDSAMIRQTALLWWLVMYVGQATKDYLGWPRPPSPPVARLETTYMSEFSMPSTHAMAGTAIPLLLAKLCLQRYQLPVVGVVGVALLWMGTTCVSRIYLGVHTVLDVICGVALALALFLVISPLTPHYDLWTQTHPLSPLLLLASSLALCTVCYPSSDKKSAKGDAIIITAVFVGVGIGSWLNFHLGLSAQSSAPWPLPVEAPSLTWIGNSLLQFVVGVAVVFMLKMALKPVMVRIFSALFGLEEADAQHEGVMVGYRYCTYLCLGLAIAFLDPLLFTTLGFGSPGYYQMD